MKAVDNWETEGRKHFWKRPANGIQKVSFDRTLIICCGEKMQLKSAYEVGGSSCLNLLNSVNSVQERKRDTSPWQATLYIASCSL